MAPDTVTLREHLETLMDERQRRTDEQFAGLRTQVEKIGEGVEGVRAEVISLKAAREARIRLRGGDYAKVGAVAAVLGVIATFIH